MQAREIRARARRALRGKWVRMAALQLLAAAVTGVLGTLVTFAAMAPLTVSAFHGLDRMIYGASATSGELTEIPPAFFVILGAGILLMCAAGSLMSVGMCRAARAAVRNKPLRPRMLFPFRLLGKALAMNLVRAALVGVQLVLLIAPGVIAAYRYSMADYLLATHSDMGPIEALRRSRQRMAGRKVELFKLQLSFLGWALLCALPMLATQMWAHASAAGGEFALASAMRGALLSLPLGLLSLAGGLCLSAYMTVAHILYFRSLQKRNP